MTNLSINSKLTHQHTVDEHIEEFSSDTLKNIQVNVTRCRGKKINVSCFSKGDASVTLNDWSL